MSKFKVGQKYGKLTVIEVLGGRKIRLKCDCGKEYISKDRYALTRSKRPLRSCGKGMCAPNFNNIQGQRFGIITVIKVSDVQDKGRNWAWDCICGCGNLFSTRAWNLTSGSTQSCGCATQSLISKANSLEENSKPSIFLYKTYKKSANERDLEFKLSISEFESFITQNCYYCGQIPSSIFTHKNYYVREPFMYNGIDRKNNDIGYILNNCLPCCKYCNYAKRERSHDEFIEYVKRIVRRFNDEQ